MANIVHDRSGASSSANAFIPQTRNQHQLYGLLSRFQLLNIPPDNSNLLSKSQTLIPQVGSMCGQSQTFFGNSSKNHTNSSRLDEESLNSNIGILARNRHRVPLTYSSRSEVPFHYLDDIWKEVQVSLVMELTYAVAYKYKATQLKNSLSQIPKGDQIEAFKNNVWLDNRGVDARGHMRHVGKHIPTDQGHMSKNDRMSIIQEIRAEIVQEVREEVLQEVRGETTQELREGIRTEVRVEFSMQLEYMQKTVDFLLNHMDLDALPMSRG
ncbi:hypothetical protein ACH5RR_033108 [Cinchona calisaya]|uniref:Uncharacterized protein n=1 Tax=Cinchona calisaya TaxID=153742 RepID=A0ABD2YJZ9_9GENT